MRFTFHLEAEEIVFFVENRTCQCTITFFSKRYHNMRSWQWWAKAIKSGDMVNVKSHDNLFLYIMLSYFIYYLEGFRISETQIKNCSVSNFFCIAVIFKSNASMWHYMKFQEKLWEKLSRKITLIQTDMTFIIYQIFKKHLVSLMVWCSWMGLKSHAPTYEWLSGLSWIVYTIYA